MQGSGWARSPRRYFVVWAWLYGLAVIYVSVVVGPLGFHFVPLDPADAWHKFLAVRYVPTNSDQRADWMANLLMLVPFGFLVGGSLWPASGLKRRCAAAVAAFVLCAAVILGIKYAQLFFPPRTVSLNYITAQCIGAALGIVVLGVCHDRATLLLRGMLPQGRQGLVLLLRIYVLILVLFMLVPFDFVLSARDLFDRLTTVPQQLVQFPGVGRPATIRVVLLAAGMVATVPLGALLVLSKPRRIGAAAATGFLLMSSVTILSLLLMTGTTSLVVLTNRSIGVVLGAVLTRWLASQDAAALRDGMRRAAPLCAGFYAAGLLLVNGLVSRHWRSPHQALAALNDHGLIPLYYYYIVTKATATRDFVAHFIMYAPIGVLFWMRRKDSPPGATVVLTAVLVSACVEFGRWLHPNRQPDINAIWVAGAAAWLAAKSLPAIWTLTTGAITGVAPRHPRLVPQPAFPVAKPRPAAGSGRGRPASLTSQGDVEHY